MDKQKQIEEMAEIMYGVEAFELEPLAEALYNAGYRKIPENAVVLTMEAQEEFTELYRSALQRAEKWEKLCGIRIKETRKETAEKFAERLKEYSITEYKEFGSLRFYKISYPQLDELVEEMTK